MLSDTLVVENGELVLKSYWCLKNSVLAKPKYRQTKKKKHRPEKRNSSACLSLRLPTASSKEQSSHPAADALSVIQDVELVDELVHTVASLGDGS